jgi:hypothetical protein
MQGMTTFIINQCDMAMEKGDFFQHPNKDPFKVPEFYGKLNENVRKNLFWARIVQPDQPFDLA